MDAMLDGSSDEGQICEIWCKPLLKDFKKWSVSVLTPVPFQESQ